MYHQPQQQPVLHPPHPFVPLWENAQVHGLTSDPGSIATCALKRFQISSTCCLRCTVTGGISWTKRHILPSSYPRSYVKFIGTSSFASYKEGYVTFALWRLLSHLLIDRHTIWSDSVMSKSSKSSYGLNIPQTLPSPPADSFGGT